MAANPEAGPIRRESVLQQRASAFWRWWTRELMGLVPERFAALRGRDRAPILALDGANAVIVDPRRGAGDLRAELAGLDEARRKAAVRALLERAGETRVRARALLGPGEALMRRVSMPAATEENLRQVLGFEMDRLTPFRADEVYFDYRVVSRDGAGQILLQVAMARRDMVDARVAALRDVGVSVQGVALADDKGPGAPLDLLPPEQRGERESARDRLVQRILAGAVVALFLIALVLPLVQKRSAIVALNPLVEHAHQQAEAAGAIAGELDRQVADYNFLLGRKHGTYSALAVIEEISRLLPDNTWVQQMDIRTVGKTREVQITGETASASKLIEILEGSSLLQNAAFRGTVTRGSAPNTERFMIAAEIRQRQQPEPRPVLEVAASVPALPTPAAAAPPAAPTAAPPAAPAAVPPAAPAAALPAAPAAPVAPPSRTPVKSSPNPAASPPPATAPTTGESDPSKPYILFMQADGRMSWKPNPNYKAPAKPAPGQ